MSFLVVDDEPKFGKFVRAVAADLGYEVRVMPKIDGTELMIWLAARHCTAEIFVATGYNPTYAATASSIGQSNGLGSVTTLIKPVPLTKLRAALSQ